MALSPDEFDFTFPEMPFEELRQERAAHGTAGYQLKNLRGSHDKMIRMHVEGISNKDIARELEVGEQTVSYTLRSELGQQKTRELKLMLDMEVDGDRIATKIHDGAINSAQLLADVVEGVGQGEGASVTEKVKASIELLRMDGYQPTQKVEKEVRHGYLDAPGVQRIMRRAQEIGITPSIEGEVIDAPVVVVEDSGEPTNGRS